jgi:hypothetical protein
MNALLKYRKLVAEEYEQLAAELNAATGSHIDGPGAQWLAETARERIGRMADKHHIPASALDDVR